MLPREALGRGWILHGRRGPVPHRFRYRSTQWLADLGARHPFRRTDHLPGRPETGLAEAARGLVRERTGREAPGRVLLLGQPRRLGFGFNPVVFFFCHDARGGLAAIVAEITNTPWGERHCYVLPVAENESRAHEHVFRFGKDFHVSPFLPMDLQYRWRFVLGARQLRIRMAVSRHGERCFDAGLALAFEPLTRAARWRAALAPSASGAVSLARIYWQALCLWLKRVPFHPHPAPRTRIEGITSHGRT